MTDEKPSLAERWKECLRRHPMLFFVAVLGLALLTAPLMMAASHATAVLYKDF